jgi:crossover junction endodeoxyribonuclease RuvC
MRVIGIDPGTGILGFGVVDVVKGNKVKMVTGGVITTPAHTPLPDRLLEIYDGLTEIIAETKPTVMAIEKLFFNQNVTTAISVAQARGVAMLTARQANLRIEEYTPQQIKQTLTGYGKADKKQMQEMVRLQLGLTEVPKPDDCADALAAAIMGAFMLAADTTV